MKNFFYLILGLGLTTVSISCKKENCTADPKPDCMCTLQYDPVCGCDGKTYGNACEAGCNGIESSTKGECK